ncbi:MAG: thioredoxin family protein [Bacteroidota bacterium]
MKTILLFIAIVMSRSSYAQSDYDTSRDNENEAVVYKGRFTFDDLAKEPSFTWFKSSTDNYKPEAATIVYLKNNLAYYDMVVLLGTWCDDSQNMLPKLYKVLQLSAYNMAKYSMYGVDRAKTAKYSEHKQYELKNVPTIILIKDHKEVGRIVETVKKSVEQDLRDIIEKDKGQIK